MWLYRNSLNKILEDEFHQNRSANFAALVKFSYRHLIEMNVRRQRGEVDGAARIEQFFDALFNDGEVHLTRVSRREVLLRIDQTD
ncbi:hypothetical protein C5C37_14010 [Rathayibacter sp. AY1F9]|nr:hypothetical protein C5C37_14010 [Rathayibacter sp. AY1F9]